MFDIESMANSSEKYLEKTPLVELLIAAISSQIESICYFVMVLMFLINPTLVNLLYPLSILFYAILENPIPAKSYWKWITKYLIVIVFLKVIIQLPIFCSSPGYGLCNCSSAEVPHEVLVKRYDYVIGIHKLNGNASLNANDSLLNGLLCDLVLLVLLVYLKIFKQKTGLWNYVDTDVDIQINPKFTHPNREQVLYD